MGSANRGCLLHFFPPDLPSQHVIYAPKQLLGSLDRFWGPLDRFATLLESRWSTPAVSPFGSELR